MYGLKCSIVHMLLQWRRQKMCCFSGVVNDIVAHSDKTGESNFVYQCVFVHMQSRAWEHQCVRECFFLKVRCHGSRIRYDCRKLNTAVRKYSCRMWFQCFALGLCVQGASSSFKYFAQNLLGNFKRAPTWCRQKMKLKYFSILKDRLTLCRYVVFGPIMLESIW